MVRERALKIVLVVVGLLFTAGVIPLTMFFSREPGLNQDHNHEMKEIFKSTATIASRCAGPLQDVYAGLLAKGMKPEMARLTLARKIAAITLTLWKKGGPFDAEHLKAQAA